MTTGADQNAVRTISDPPPGFLPARVSIPPGSIPPGSPTDVLGQTTGVSLGTISYAPRREEANAEQFVIRSRLETRILWLAFACAASILVLYYWDVLGVVTRILVGLFTGAILIGAVDFFQKIYVLLPGEVRHRVMFMWVNVPLPDVFSVERVRGGGIVFINSIDKEVFFSIGRDMADETMTNALMSLYHYRAHTSFEIS